MTKSKLVAQLVDQHKAWCRNEHAAFLKSEGIQPSAIDLDMETMWDDMREGDVIAGHLCCSDCCKIAATDAEIEQAIAASRNADEFLSRFMADGFTCISCAADWPSEL